MEKTTAGSTPEVGIGAGGPPAKRRRVLIAATTGLAGDELVEQLAKRGVREGAEVRVVSPAITDSALEHAMGSVDDAIVQAQERLDASVRDLGSHGIDAHGQVGDADPALAIEDALREFEADLIVIVTRAGDDARWLEGDLFDRAKQRFEPEIVHVETSGEREVVDVESAGAGTEPGPDAEVEGYSKNTPRFSARDLLGIFVAVVGTLAAILLAVSCDDGNTLQRTTAEAGEGTNGSCVAAYIVAGLTALVNVAHVVGLMLFESVGYRGGWSRFFANLSLFGTPVAILVTALLVS
jgi:hypothetical protein